MLTCKQCNFGGGGGKSITGNVSYKVRIEGGEGKGGREGGSLCGVNSSAVVVKRHWPKRRGFCFLSHQTSSLPLFLFRPPAVSSARR